MLRSIVVRIDTVSDGAIVDNACRMGLLDGKVCRAPNGRFGSWPARSTVDSGLTFEGLGMKQTLAIASSCWRIKVGDAFDRSGGKISLPNAGSFKYHGNVVFLHVGDRAHVRIADSANTLANLEIIAHVASQNRKYPAPRQ